MSGFAEELPRLLAVGRNWVGRELHEDEVIGLVNWLKSETAHNPAAAGQIDRGLAAASSVIAQGRQAAEGAIADAFRSVRGAPPPSQAPGKAPPPSLHERVTRTEQRVLEQVLKSGVVGEARIDPAMEAQFAQLAQHLANLIETEVVRQVELRMVEFDARTGARIEAQSTQVVELCNQLSAEIRQQLARDLRAETALRPARPAPQKKS
ncbi:hypothetical protein [Ruegeria sp. PrR005]|uniref:Uncharacterized protein n=1 Tax=Ruegeria sp. PrR005 TaxID=2706882 RepID=A0A6B2NKF7_9RHOB|nr:hypothetical protein [Ruegeria sp. PrR005]NDW44602.1 hypothetical protein [Ruegeria sp. PrR005]